MSHRVRLTLNILLATLLLLIVGRFLVVGQAKVLFNQNSSDGDESAYLSLGLALREAGVLSDGTRPPLYPLFLAAVAQREWAYFTWAKLITLLMGAAAVLATFWVGWRLFDPATGLLAAFLLAANREFHLRAATVYADTLLVGLLVLAWYFLSKSFQQRRFALLAGIFVGLAYLTKSSATLLLLAWGIAAMLIYRRRLVQQWPTLLLVPATFIATTLPLLLFNMQQFGSPFYSFATTHVMWMDRWADSQVADPADLPTLTSYLQTHTPAQMTARLVEGITELHPELTITLIPSRQFEPPWSGLLLAGLTLAALLWWAAARRSHLAQVAHRRRFLLTFTLAFFTLFYLSSVWYAYVLIESRFLIPLLGPVYILLAAFAVATLRQLYHWLLTQAPTRRRLLTGSFGAAIALLLVGGLGWLWTTTQTDAWSLGVDPFESDRQANAQPEAVLQWFQRDHPPAHGPALLLFGPSKSLPLWKFPPRFTIERLPVEIDTWPKLENYLTQTAPDYLVLDSDTVRRRRAALNEYFSYSENAMNFATIPPGWTLAYLYDDLPTPWSIFTPARQPQTTLTATFADQVQLLGYDLTINQPERRLDGVLYWQALAPLPENYVVFVHLTAPDGFVKAQQDRRPFEGRWPTSRWQPGVILADRFTIPLDQSITPGDYLLLAGLYHPADGQRLPLLAGPPAPSPDAVLLQPLQLDNLDNPPAN